MLLLPGYPIPCNDNIEKINQLFLIHKIKILNETTTIKHDLPLD